MILGYIMQVDAMSEDGLYDVDNPRASRIDSWRSISRWARGCTFTHDLTLCYPEHRSSPLCLQTGSTLSSTLGTSSSVSRVWRPQHWRRTRLSSRLFLISRRVPLGRRLAVVPLSNPLNVSLDLACFETSQRYRFSGLGGTICMFFLCVVEPL